MAYTQLVDTTPYQQLPEAVEAPKGVETSVSVSAPAPNVINPLEFVATHVSRPSSGRALDPLPPSELVMTVAAPDKAA